MKSKKLLISTGASLALTMALSLSSCTDTPGLDNPQINDTNASYYWVMEELMATIMIKFLTLKKLSATTETLLL